MSYLYQYLLFLAQAVTIAVVVLVIFSGLASLGSRRSQGGASDGHLTVTKLNEQLEDTRNDLRSMLLDKDAFKELSKREAKQRKREAKLTAKNAAKSMPKSDSDETADAEETTEVASEGTDSSTGIDGRLQVAEPLPGRPRLFVIDFEGDIQASRVEQLRREITALLTVASLEDEVLVRVESPGGLVHAYGLAASQLARVRDRKIPLTVAVDKVAASGGYMMAAVANRILSAPFAVVGSIGVVAQVPNVHRLLKKNDIDVEVLTAGKYKRTLTVVGENTEEGREKFIEELEVTHALFQEHIAHFRPAVDVAAVATGEAWYGERAIAMQLVDELITSDDYLLSACGERDVLLLKWQVEKKPLDRLLERTQLLVSAVMRRLAGGTDGSPGGFGSLLGRIRGKAPFLPLAQNQGAGSGVSEPTETDNQRDL